MWAIIKYEITYFKRFSVITYLLPAVYPVLLLYNMDYNEQFDDLYRIFGTLIFGMLPVLLIAVAFTSSLKEKRTAMMISLPLRVNRIGTTRIMFFICPLIYLNLIGLLALHIAGDSWYYITNKVVYQYGAVSMLLSALYVSYEFLMAFEIRNDINKILFGVAFFAIVLTTLYLVDNLLWDKILQAYIGWLYTIVSLLTILIGRFLFLKRKIYSD